MPPASRQASRPASTRRRALSPLCPSPRRMQWRWPVWPAAATCDFDVAGDLPHFNETTFGASIRVWSQLGAGEDITRRDVHGGPDQRAAPRDPCGAPQESQGGGPRMRFTNMHVKIPPLLRARRIDEGLGENDSESRGPNTPAPNWPMRRIIGCFGGATLADRPAWPQQSEMIPSPAYWPL